MFYVVEIGEFMSSHFDFREVNFDTMKLFRYAEMVENLMPQGFLSKEKARWFRIKTIVLMWWSIRN